MLYFFQKKSEIFKLKGFKNIINSLKKDRQIDIHKLSLKDIPCGPNKRL